MFLELLNTNIKMSEQPLVLVGNLQKISRSPIASVYMDRCSRSLYLFVRINGIRDASPIYVATDTTAESLIKYLNRRIVLRTLFANKPREYACVVNGVVQKIDYSDEGETDERLKRAGRFEPELCSNRIELEFFFSNY